jgi:mono/diheme cytochrome c family protein
MRFGVLVALLAAAWSWNVVRAEGPGVQGEAYYTDAQAARGQALFEKHCAACHFAEPDPEKAKLEKAGFMLGKSKVISNLGAPYIATSRIPRGDGRRIYTTVYYLFRELESMPAVTDSITQQMRTDIVAYMLKQNKFPAGRTELKFDTAAMKLMPLDEPGFALLFNGKDFTGWKFLFGLGCTPPPGCGTTQPSRVVAAKDGTLTYNGKEHGIAYTEKTYKDFNLRFDYVGDVPPDWEGDDVYYYANSGVHLFLMDENLFIWPKALTLKGEQRELMDPIVGVSAGVAAKAKAHTYDMEAMHRAVHRLGQWNSIEIVSKGSDVKAYVNDVLVSTVTQHEFTTPGHIGLQLQGFPMRFRNLRIRED